MGKSKKSSKESSAAAKKCTCDHPYNCSCGNRPPRPSKGHKWDADQQAWGGKGHKQKGASGQTAAMSAEAKTTAVGKTQVHQWQRLPTQLLEDYCKREKRPRAKYKNIEKQSGLYKYRVILPDPKNSEKDFFFVCQTAVANEEQAMQEGALLALLHVQPSIPHERKLPEPYKTTWLNAIQQQKKTPVDSTKQSNNNSNNAAATRTSKSSKSTSAAAAATSAQASSNLTKRVGYVSLADKRRQKDEKRRARSARIRHHENVRLANQNLQVFMSAQIRREIESLIRGDAVGSANLSLQDDDAEDEELTMQDEELDDVQVYVQERLHHEGFTRRQARSAYQEILKQSNNNNVGVNEDLWDKVYEECLQWLLIHLDEDHLPEGFDPRGRMLDVVVPVSAAAAAAKQRKESCDSSGDHITFADQYGIPVQEAKLIHERATKVNKSAEDVLWATLQSAADVSLPESAAQDLDKEQNREIAREEQEALDAIFASEWQMSTKDELSLISIAIDDSELSLLVLVRDGAYPSTWPERVLVSGKWPSNVSGSAIQAEIVKFVASLHLGEPMVFEIHGFVQSLLQSSELSPSSLMPFLGADGSKLPKPVTQKGQQKQQKSLQKGPKSGVSSSRIKAARRPRERSPFWSTLPKQTPPAVAFPKISRSLEGTRKSLPAAGARDEFLAVLKQARQGGRVLLVTGDTGCGKTTQIPQYILEESPDAAKIVVAQPRRLAATGVASRVASERGESKPGIDSVGYVVRGDYAMSKRSRLVFCTTGVLLRQLQNEGALDCVSHIVVDEVHERNLDTDILLGLLKQSLATNPHLCVVLMSATLDADRFAAYWGKNTPRMHIPGRTFPVADYTLEDVLSLTGYIPPKKKKKGKAAFYVQTRRKNSSPWADSERSDEEEDPEDDGAEEDSFNGERDKKSIISHGLPIEELVKRVDETSVDYDLVGRLVKHLVANKDPSDDGSILVFLSGAPEINKAMETIRRCTRGLPILLLPLHGGLQPKDQNIVFRPAEKGFTKVILSTNVAETSVTIPDCTVVIDSAREKQSSYDPGNRMPLLVEKFASKASLKQRRGRAGRVRKGTRYKLISRSTHEKLKEHGDPEIKRCALDQTLLSLLFLGVERGPGTFMQTLLDPPSKESLEAAAFSLQKLGAVESGGKDGTLNLTPLGMHLAGIPAPPTIGKMLVMGSILGCREPALAMAAGMSAGRSPFLRIDNRRSGRNDATDDQASIEDMKNQRILDERSSLFQTVGNSDHAFLAAVYLKWKSTGTGSGLRKRFCDSLGLSFTGMRDMSQLERQLDSSLSAAGFPASPESNRNAQSWRIIHACAVSAMAPSQLVKVVRPAATYHETAEGAKEKDGEARELKFFVRTDKGTETAVGSDRVQEERVFVHPSSANFATGSYSCPWLVYHSLVRTSKAFLRDVTECSAYALLLFGGRLDVQASKGVIVIDDWAQLSANARIGSLMGGLRRNVDALLTKKVEDPFLEISTTREMQLIRKLIMTDGLGT